ncbi:MAG: phosphonate ABC transporter ATP-binding protein [Acidimicrobiaceae bacterium]|nr:phosphonate ABC transporter ATP-binding protein [Acidimicrobiaceae bacterium]
MSEVPADAEPALWIRGLGKSFPTKRDAVVDVDLQVWPGELVAVLGANGSGKSTMLRCVVSLLQPSAGSVIVAGNDLSSLRGRELRDARQAVGMVFQQGHLVRRRSALRNAASGCLGRHHRPATMVGRLPRHELELGWSCLERVGMTEVAHRRADTLSGGQAQRVAIARTLAQQPSVLLADEPVASLDPEAAAEVMTILRQLAVTEGLGVVVVLHQPELALRHAHRVVGMRAGRAVFDVPVTAADPQAIGALYRAGEDTDGG